MLPDDKSVIGGNWRGLNCGPVVSVTVWAQLSKGCLGWRAPVERYCGELLSGWLPGAAGRKGMGSFMPRSSRNPWRGAADPREASGGSICINDAGDTTTNCDRVGIKRT